MFPFFSDLRTQPLGLKEVKEGAPRFTSISFLIPA